MAITQKVVNLENNELTEQQWAASNAGTYMNMLLAVRYDPVDNKYKFPRVIYSDTPLEGENIKFESGQELTIGFSCLANEYENKKEVYDKWWDKANEIVKAYKEQLQLDEHIASNNTDLKRLRKEGTLLDTEDLNE